MIIKNALNVVKIAERLAKVFSEHSRNLLLIEVEKRYRQNQIEDRGNDDDELWLAGLNAGCRISDFNIDVLDFDKVVKAISGDEVEVITQEEVVKIDEVIQKIFNTG